MLQTYRSCGSFLQLWFEAAAHQKLQGQYETWGGLWTADNADAFVQDAVRMYRAEEDWHTWQQRGFELLRNLYNKEARLGIVKVMFGRLTWAIVCIKWKTMRAVSIEHCTV